MGCDIHVAIERADYATGRWKFVASFDLGRNYHLFGILAGVRTDHTPIVEPRGLPTDRDPKSYTQADDDHYGHAGDDEFGDHTRSWLTLAELRAYDWCQALPDSGCIPLRFVDYTRGDDFYKEPYTEWRKTPPHPPNGRCGGTSGAQILDLRGGNSKDQEFAERLISHPEEMPEPEDPPSGAIYRDDSIGRTWGWERGKKYPRTAWARVQWTIAAKDACSEFYAWMQRQDTPADDLRIVFGFDS